MQHVRTMDGPKRSYANVKYEPAGKRKSRRLVKLLEAFLLLLLLLVLLYL